MTVGFEAAKVMLVMRISDRFRREVVGVRISAIGVSALDEYDAIRPPPQEAAQDAEAPALPSPRLSRRGFFFCADRCRSLERFWRFRHNTGVMPS